MQQERRRGHRTRIPDAYVTYVSANHEPSEAELHDIGTGGFFVPATAPLPRGTRVAVELRLSRGGPAWAALGRVVWTRANGTADRPSGMGVKILDIDEAAAAAIERAIGPAPPARERTVRGIGVPTPPSVWVAEAPSDARPETPRGSKGRGTARRARRGAWATVCLLAAMAAAVGAMNPSRARTVRAAALTAVAAPSAQAPSTLPPENAPVAPAPSASSDVSASVASPPAGAPPPSPRPAPRRRWIAPPKVRPEAASDNPY